MSTPASEKLRKAREAALWALYGMDVTNAFWAGDLDDFYLIARDQDAELDQVRAEVEVRVRGVVEGRAQLDTQIGELSPRWRLERMAVIDRNLLRMGIWEILAGHTAPLIVINACVELAKEYGEQGTPGFINGLLDQVCKDYDIKISPQGN